MRTRHEPQHSHIRGRQVNTIHLDHALAELEEQGHPADPALFQHLSPLGWEHINLTGDYTWPTPRQR